MKKYICDVCGWIYDPEVGDPEGGIAPGTAFEDIPDDWNLASSSRMISSVSSCIGDCIACSPPANGQ